MNKLLVEKFQANLDRVFMIDSNLELTLSYNQIFKRSMGVANFLYKNGIRKGSKVGIILNNCVEFITIYIANMFLGAVSIPVNPNFIVSDYEFILGKCQPDILLTTTEKIAQFLDSQFNPGCPEIDIEQLQFSQLNSATLDFNLPQISWDDTVAILYTSGTTGKPKGVVMKFGAVFENFKNFGTNLGFNSDTRFMQIVPLFHAHGWLYSSLVPIIFGASLVLNEPFGVRLCLKFWDVVQAHRANVMVGVPSMLTSLLQLKDRLEVIPQGAFQYVICGSAFLHPRLKKDFETTFGTIIYEFYGSTETLYISYHHPELEYHEESVGKLIPGNEIKIADDGEILVKTKYLFKEYFSEPQLTQEVFEDGWFKSGDLGRIDPKGYIHLTGRKKDLINKGGFKISPKEITDALLSYKGVVDAATIGVPDLMYGEEIYAFVHLDETYNIQEEDLYQHCKTVLNPKICPRRIVVLKLIPKNAVGKVDKFKLNEIVEQKYRSKD